MSSLKLSFRKLVWAGVAAAAAVVALPEMVSAQFVPATPSPPSGTRDKMPRTPALSPLPGRTSGNPFAPVGVTFVGGQTGGAQGQTGTSGQSGNQFGQGGGGFGGQGGFGGGFGGQGGFGGGFGGQGGFGGGGFSGFGGGFGGGQFGQFGNFGGGGFKGFGFGGDLMRSAPEFSNGVGVYGGSPILDDAINPVSGQLHSGRSSSRQHTPLGGFLTMPSDLLLYLWTDSPEFLKAIAARS